MSAFSFPILILNDRNGMRGSMRVFFEDDPVAEGLALGDVVSDELNVDIPAGACVIVLGQGAPAGLRGSFLMMAEILHACIARRQDLPEVSLFDWALRSLVLRWRSELCADAMEIDRLCRDVSAIVLGYGKPLASGEFDRYMKLLDPAVGLRAPDIDLLDALSKAQGLSDWIDILQSRNGQARVVPCSARLGSDDIT